MTRGRKAKPGRVVLVGSGPGDPGLLTVRARSVLSCAELVFTDPDVPAEGIDRAIEAAAAVVAGRAGRSASK